jgi:hypothetical protein
MANSNLLSKLKYRPEHKMLVLNAPEDYLPNLEGIHYFTDLSKFSGEADMLHIFVYSKDDVDRLVPESIKRLKPDGLLWMSYPKGTSKINTDINRNKGWETLKNSGLQGIAMIAIDDTWAAMRFRPMEKIKHSRKE